MKNVQRIALLWLLLAATACPAALADQVALKNGDRLTGSIVKSDGKELVLKTDAIGQVTIQWAAIDSITAAEPLNVAFTGGETVVGPVTTVNGALNVATPTNGTVTVPKDSVTAIRDKTEEAAYEKLQHPRFLDLWGGTFDTGLSLTSGNSSTVAFTLAAKAVREAPQNTLTLYATTVYTRNDTTAPATTIADQITGGIRIDENLGKARRAFLFAATDFNTNALQHLDLQNVIDGGAGYHLVKRKATTFDAFLGAGFNQEYFAAYTTANPAPPPPTLSFGAISQKNTELDAGETLGAKLGSKTTFNETFTIYPNVSGPSGYRFTFNSTAVTALNKWLGWHVTFGDNFLSNPPFGIKDNDFVLSTGLHLAFGEAAK